MKNPNDTFFINSNINTPALTTVNKHPYKVVVTANPNITGTPADLNKIMQKFITIKDHIAFVRVKFVPGIPFFIELLAMLLAVNIPVVITLQRFNSLESLSRFTDRKYYQHSCSRFRLAGPMLKAITQLVTRYRNRVWICDQKGLGCSGCGLCSKLTTGKSYKVYSLNLSSSGICPYNCPDCYAKTMQNFSRKMGHNPLVYNKIQQNKKQSGRTAHIKEALKQCLDDLIKDNEIQQALNVLRDVRESFSQYDKYMEKVGALVK
jgi:hypothetical protein